MEKFNSAANSAFSPSLNSDPTAEKDHPTGWEELEMLGRGQGQNQNQAPATIQAAPNNLPIAPNPALETVQSPDLPTTSKNRTCNFYLKLISGDGRMSDIKNFLETAAQSEASEPPSPDFYDTYATKASATLSPSEKSALKNYSGFNYKYINQVARGQWSYDILGRQTPENLARAEASISELSQAIAASPAPESDLTAYRGTNLDSFQGYDIHSIQDVANLKNQFFLESGFTSTSLDPAQSFADRADFDDPLRRACNITIDYHIPAGCDEVAGLFSDETSYSPAQRELLIDRGSLSYVSDVKISEDNSSAKLKMTLIPRSLYDPQKPQNP